MTEHPDMQQLSAHLDAELDGPGTAAVSRHLLGCPQCQRRYRQLQALGEDLQELPSLQPQLDIGALLDQLPPRRPPQPATRRWHRIAPGLGAAAAVILGLWVGNSLHSPATVPPAAELPALAILGSAPPGALCRQPELCYLHGSLQ